jgi:hypothetical protein
VLPVPSRQDAAIGAPRRLTAVVPQPSFQTLEKKNVGHLFLRRFL